jgi:hypothetical protein
MYDLSKVSLQCKERGDILEQVHVRPMQIFTVDCIDSAALFESIQPTPISHLAVTRRFAQSSATSTFVSLFSKITSQDSGSCQSATNPNIRFVDRLSNCPKLFPV